MSPAHGPGHPPRARRPWWILHIFGSMPAIDERSVRLLGMVSLAIFFENYDLSMLMSALGYIAADFQVTEAALAKWAGVIRLGAIPAFFLVPLADRVGRRRMFLVAVAGISLATFVTAFTQSVAWFVLAQMLFRTFMMVSATLAFVIVAEEFPAEHRGWGIGMLGAIGATGFGFGAILFAFVESLPGGWRALYVVGLTPIFFLGVLRRGIPETARFARLLSDRAGAPAAPASGDRDRAGGIGAWIAPIRELAATYPRRVLAVTLAGGLYSMAEMSVFQFCGYFTLTAHGWEPWRFSTMVIAAGAVGMVGNVMAGKLGDAYGRRPVGLTVATAMPVSAFLFYHLPGFWLPPLWAVLTVCSVSTNTMIRALGTEVFPTSHRGTAGGWLSLVQTIGSASGLAITGVATGAGWPLPDAVSAVAALAAFAGASLFLLPETSRLELEAIADDAH